MRLVCLALIGWWMLAAAARAERIEVNIPVLVPLTGFLSLEGTSQRNGALLALADPPKGIAVRFDVADTGVSPEVAVNALERALTGGQATAVVASMLGTQMLAMLPLARERRVPLLTVSGTAQITELGNPYVFRFFPGDEVTKAAHVRYAVEELGRRRPAIVYQTTAYGQSGRRHIVENLARRGISPVFEQGIDVQIRDMSTILSKVRATDPDVILLHLHSAPTALLVRQAAAMKLDVPIVAGSAMHQPPTAALLEPAELKNVCAEANASPVSGGSPELDRFLADYRATFGGDPDGFALAQYDAVRMALVAVEGGARGPDELAAALSRMTYDGLAMRYRSDGKGNMAHGAVIMCYDGADRVPRVVKRYESPVGVPAN
ncbi:MAG TPA: ABC transporter substrate-binding protein [Alphaproteobacteria bacterium]|nr:ABC transporter substrate-binding protein [Alphaproteobacteria bacterium]